MARQRISIESLRGIHRAYLLTLGAVLVVGAESLVGYKIVSLRLGASAFAAFALSQRALNLLQPAFLVGTGVALPRFIPAATEERSQRYARDLYLAAAAIVVTALAATTVVAMPFASTLSRIVFGPEAPHATFRAFIALLWGSCLAAVTWAYLRGLMEMGRAACWLILAYAIVPLLAAIVGRSVAGVIALTGLTNAFLSIVLVVVSCRPFPSWKQTGIHVKSLLHFGLRRVPGEFMIFGLLAVPPIAAVHLRGSADAGQFAFAVAIITAISALFAPISLVLLPVASHLVTQARQRELGAHAVRLVSLALGGSLILCGFLELGAGRLLGAFVGHSVEPNLFSLRLTFAAIPAHVIYVVLRSIIDASHYKAVNMRNASLAFFLSSSLLGASSIMHVDHAPEFALVTGAYLLSILTIIDVRRVLTGTANNDSRDP